MVSEEKKIDEEIDYIGEEYSDDSFGDASEIKNDQKGKNKKKGCCGMFRNTEEDRKSVV